MNGAFSQHSPISTKRLVFIVWLQDRTIFWSMLGCKRPAQLSHEKRSETVCISFRSFCVFIISNCFNDMLFSPSESKYWNIDLRFNTSAVTNRCSTIKWPANYTCSTCSVKCYRPFGFTGFWQIVTRLHRRSKF
jgi:hypothetical protein